ncbi:MAG: hypothetical protein II951_10090 [Bacteroidales bacterium]|nr:hypothetical protein [Bacteroidales bacterium]
MKKHYEKPVIEAVELDRQVVAMLGSRPNNDNPTGDPDQQDFPGDDPWEDPFAD